MVRIPDHLSVVVGLGSLVGLQRVVILAYYGHYQGLRVVVQLRVVAHATTACNVLFAH